jgi:hypothetical protein
VIACDDTTCEPAGGLTERRANVTVRAYPELLDALRDGRRINWRGIAWRAYSPVMGLGRGESIVTLQLVAVAPRDWTPADLPAHRR